MLNKLFAFLLLPLSLLAQEQANVLLYKDPVQVSSEINAYQNLVPGAPIQGSVMVTHASNNYIDPSSFKENDKPLKVEFVRDTPVSEFSNLVISIYRFRLEGKPQGSYTLTFSVTVGRKEYAAPPLQVQIPSN